MPQKLKKFIWIIPVVIIVLIFFFNCFYSVSETERGVLTTFGKVTSIQNAGLNFKLPDPIQSVQKVDMTTQKLYLGYSEGAHGEIYVNENDAKMITGDYNVVSVDFFMEWKVSDPEKFLFNSENPVLILENVAKAACRDIIGSYDVDNVLTDGKVPIQAGIKELMTQRLEQYDIGIQILEIKIQDAEPPTPKVTAAFKDVETAKQQMDTTINQATAYKNTLVPEANAEADKIIRDAEAYKQKRINDAMGEVAKFNEMFNQFINNKEITMKRMYLETMEEILPGVKIYIDTSANGVQTLLPLETLVNGGAN